MPPTVADVPGPPTLAPRGVEPTGDVGPAPSRIGQSARSLDDTVRLLAGGASFGFADEAAAGINTLLGVGPGKTFEENLKAEQERDAAIRAREPGAALAGEVAGGAAVALPGAARVMGARALQGVPGVVKAAGLGGTAGAVAGAGNAPQGQRLEGAVLGGAAGVALGGALNVIKDIAVKAAQRLLATDAGKDVQQAASKILQALQRDEMTPEDALRRMRELGPEARLIDVGDNVRDLGRAVAGKPGRGKKIALDTLEGRQEGQTTRVVEAVNRALDPDGNFQGAVEDLQKLRLTEARPLYQKAYAKPVEPSEELISLFQRPAMQQAFRRAQRIAANEGENIPDLFDGQRVNPDALRDVKLLDFVKRGLDDMVETNRDPITRRIVGEVAKGVDNVRKQYIGILDELSPDYKAARAAWSGPTRSLEVMERGRGFIRGDEEIITRQLEAMTDDEKLFFRMGAARQLRELIRNTPDGADAVKRIFGSDLKRSRLQRVFPDEETFGAFRKAMESEAELFKTRQIVSPRSGSMTELRQEGAADLATDIGTGVAELARGNTGNAARRFLRPLLGNRVPEMSPETYEALARALFTKDPAANKAIVRALSIQQMLENPGQVIAGASAIEGGREVGAAIAR